MTQLQGDAIRCRFRRLGTARKLKTCEVEDARRANTHREGRAGFLLCIRRLLLCFVGVNQDDCKSFLYLCIKIGRADRDQVSVSSHFVEGGVISQCDAPGFLMSKDAALVKCCE